MVYSRAGDRWPLVLRVTDLSFLVWKRLVGPLEAGIGQPFFVSTGHLRIVTYGTHPVLESRVVASTEAPATPPEVGARSNALREGEGS